MRTPPRSHTASRSPCSASCSERAKRRSSPPPTAEAEPRTPPRRHQPLPVDLLAFLGPLPCPELCHFLWHRLGRLAHHLHAGAHRLLGPPPAPALVACASSHRCLRGERPLRADWSRSLRPSSGRGPSRCVPWP